MTAALVTSCIFQVRNALLFFVKLRSSPLIRSEVILFPALSIATSKPCPSHGQGFGWTIHKASGTIWYDKPTTIRIQDEADQSSRHGKKGESWSSFLSRKQASDGGLSWLLALAS